MRDVGAKRFRTRWRRGTIAIVEYLPDDDRTGEPIHLIFAVNMLVNTPDGDTYTFGEINEWLHQAGFENVRRVTLLPHPQEFSPTNRGALTAGPRFKKKPRRRQSRSFDRQPKGRQNGSDD